MTVHLISVGLATFQDTGRHHHVDIGVPTAGPADLRAYLEGAWLIGGTPATAIEFVGALALTTDEPLVCAHTGADADVTINGRIAPSRSTLHLSAGDTLSVSGAHTGVYSYLSTPGGWDVAPTLGSAATDTLSGLGPAPLRGGDTLTPSGAPVPARACRGAVSTAPVHLTEGPHVSLLGRDVFDALADRAWAIGAGSSRVGLRLTGDLIAHEAPTLKSLPMLDGAIQLTPSGQPIVLGPDHGTAGGYPVIGMLTRQGVNALYRLREGDTFTFTRTLVAPDHSTRYELAYV